MQLPDSYELIIGNKVENIHEYYQLLEVAAIGDIHGIKLIMNIPLKTTNIHFILYKTIALPTRISDDKFVKYVFDYLYFGLDKNQHDYILLSEADLLRCKTSSITICSADVAIYHASTLTCQASLFLQRTDSQNLCQRSLLLHHKTPTLQRHGTIWLYQFPEPQQAVIHCPGIDDKTPRTEILSGMGIIHNASRCSISTSPARLCVYGLIIQKSATSAEIP